MEHLEQIETRLWEYIDGQGNTEERSAIEELIRQHKEWKDKYAELLEVHSLIQSTELEQPSMRFTQNVMEEIAKYQITPATKKYINTRVIWGIVAFFIVTIVGFLVYGISQIDWSVGGSDSRMNIDLTRVDYSRMFDNNYVTMFMMLNIILGLMLLDRYLANRRKEHLDRI